MGDVDEEWDDGAEGEEYSDEEGESNTDGSDEDEEDIQLRHKRERMDRLKESPPSEIIEEAKQQARSEVRATMNSVESLKDIGRLIRGREQELEMMKMERSKVLRGQVSSARTAINLLEASQLAIDDIRHKFDDVKDHIFKKNLPRKNQILELSFKHSMIEHIVNSVEMIKDLAKSDGILKDLRGKIKDEKKFEFELLQIHKTIEGIETLRDRLHRMALDPTQIFQPSDNADSWAPEKFRAIKPVVKEFEENMWYYMEDCLSVAMEKPRVLVKINQIIEFETMRDLDRIELGEPFKPKKWMEVCDEKIQIFIDKRFKYFEITSPEEEKGEKMIERDRAHEEGQLSQGEMKIIASHLAGFGVTIEEMHRRVDDLSNIKEYLIPCFPDKAQGNEVRSRGENVSRTLFTAFHQRLFYFLEYLAKQREMLILAPRSIVKYIDFIENYYWRMDEQLFVDTDATTGLLRPDLRTAISIPMRAFYLEGMRRKFGEFANAMCDADYTTAGSTQPEEGGEFHGLIKSSTVQDVFNMLYQNIKTIEEMNDQKFLAEGYSVLGKCLYDYTSVISQKLHSLEHDGMKNDMFLFGAITVNNTVPFVKESDVFIAKAMVSCGEYASMLVTEEEDFDDIIAKLQDVQQQALSSTVNALLKKSTDKHLTYVFVPGKWYPGYDGASMQKKIKKSNKLPAVVAITDDLNYGFEKLQPVLPPWDMIQLITLTLERLLTHYALRIFKSDDMKIGTRETKKPNSPWIGTAYFMEDMNLIKELFKHWIKKTDPGASVADPDTIVDGLVGIMMLLLDLINIEKSDATTLGEKVEKLAWNCPDFDVDSLQHICDGRAFPTEMVAQLVRKLGDGKAESEGGSSFMPFSEVIKAPEEEQEVAASAADEEAAEEAADVHEEAMQKIQAAFEDATIDLENRGDEAMDLDDFMNQ